MSMSSCVWGVTIISCFKTIDILNCLFLIILLKTRRMQTQEKINLLFNYLKFYFFISSFHTKYLHLSSKYLEQV